MRRSDGRGSTVDLRLLIKTVGRDEDLTPSYTVATLLQTQERMRPCLRLRLHYIPLLFWRFLEFGDHCLHIDTAHLEYVSQLGVFTASYLFKVSSVNCHGWVVHKPAIANSLEAWGRHGCPKEKPTVLVRRRNTPFVCSKKKGEAISARSNKSNTGVKRKRIFFW